MGENLPWLKRRLRRFRADISGATAVEFAFIALPFFALLFAILQTGLTLLAAEYLQTRTGAAAREIMVGSASSLREDFRQHICTDNHLFSCDKLGIEVRSALSFAASDPSEMKAECAAAVDPKKPDPALDARCFNKGAGKQVMIVRVTYNWPFGIDITRSDGEMVLAATAVFLNEPFP